MLITLAYQSESSIRYVVGPDSMWGAEIGVRVSDIVGNMVDVRAIPGGVALNPAKAVIVAEALTLAAQIATLIEGVLVDAKNTGVVRSAVEAEYDTEVSIYAPEENI